MHPVTMERWIALKKANPKSRFLQPILDAHHFSVSKGIGDFAWQMAVHENDIKAIGEPFAAPMTAELPAQATVVHVETSDDTPTTYVAFKAGDRVAVRILNLHGVVDIGDYIPDGPVRAPVDAYGDVKGDLVRFFALIISLINHPRFIATRQEAAPRQQRRELQRRYGVTVGGYTQVGWELGKPIIAHKDRSDPLYRMPLHWCRAHYRTCEASEPGAKWHSDIALWRRRVSDCWKGHPAFGVKLQNHVTWMPGEKPIHKGDLIDVIGPEKMAIMSAQKAAALRAACKGELPHG